MYISKGLLHCATILLLACKHPVSMASASDKYIGCYALETRTLKLVAYEASLHGKAFFDGVSAHPELFRYTPIPRWESVEVLNEWAQKLREDPTRMLFAMVDKTRAPSDDVSSERGTGAVAGIIALLHTPENLAAEIGFLYTLPAFQRTHVTRTAVALLLRLAFDGLRVRRVQWRALAENVASVRAAERMGFQKEGVHRWDRVVLPGVPGNMPRKEDPRPDSMGLHVLYLAICWDDWESGWAERAKLVLEGQAAAEGL